MDNEYTVVWAAEDGTILTEHVLAVGEFAAYRRARELHPLLLKRAPEEVAVFNGTHFNQLDDTETR